MFKMPAVEILDRGTIEPMTLTVKAESARLSVSVERHPLPALLRKIRRRQAIIDTLGG